MLKHKIHDISDIDISSFINFSRSYLKFNDFFDIKLKNLVNYYVTNTNFISLDKNINLRYTSEPEIWEKGKDLDCFFSVVNLFRNEDIHSIFHRNEFTIIDIYKKNWSEKDFLGFVFEMLEKFENQNCFFNLSKLPKITISYEDFELKKELRNECIYIVREYPIEESFFDTINNISGKSNKVELFFVINSEIRIEFGVLGEVGVNVNDKYKLINRDVNFPFEKENLFGGCLGIERLLLIYKILNHEFNKKIL